MWQQSPRDRWVPGRKAAAVPGQQAVLTFWKEHLGGLLVYDLALVGRATVHKQDGTPAAGTPDPVFLQRRQECGLRKKPGKSCFPDATPQQEWTGGFTGGLGPLGELRHLEAGNIRGVGGEAERKLGAGHGSPPDFSAEPPGWRQRGGGRSHPGGLFWLTVQPS